MCGTYFSPSPSSYLPFIYFFLNNALREESSWTPSPFHQLFIVYSSSCCFFVCILGIAKLCRRELFLPHEYLQSLRGTYVSFNLVAVQWGCWRGTIHTSHPAGFQFHRSHQSLPSRLGVCNSVSRGTRPWMCTFNKEGVPITAVRWSAGRSAALSASSKLASGPFTLLILFSLFFFPLNCLFPIDSTLSCLWLNTFLAIFFKLFWYSWHLSLSKYKHHEEVSSW